VHQQQKVREGHQQQRQQQWQQCVSEHAQVTDCTLAKWIMQKAVKLVD
jgi:hypothetical protein